MPEKNQITELLSHLKAGDAILSKQGNKHIFYVLLHQDEEKFYWGFTNDFPQIASEAVKRFIWHQQNCKSD